MTSQVRSKKDAKKDAKESKKDLGFKNPWSFLIL
jgi:hypothetical protein